MDLSILGADGGKFAVLSTSFDAANQNVYLAWLKETLDALHKHRVGSFCASIV